MPNISQEWTSACSHNSHYVPFVCSLDVLKLLFHHAEDTGGYVLLSRMIMDQDRDEQTALHLAVENGHTDIVNLLIDKGIGCTNFLRCAKMILF